MNNNKSQFNFVLNCPPLDFFKNPKFIEKAENIKIDSYILKLPVISSKLLNLKLNSTPLLDKEKNFYERLKQLNNL